MDESGCCAMSLTELFERAEQERQEWSHKIYIKGGCLILNVQGEYAIELSRINSKDKVLAWIKHLVGKTWFSRKALYYMLIELQKHLGIQFDLPV